MPKTARQLEPIAVTHLVRLKKPGVTFVGSVPGLALSISKSGSCSWILRAMVAGKRRDIGLGGYPTVTLKDARAKARAAREEIEKGVDPIDARRAAASAAKAARAAARTFDECAAAYIAGHEPGWTNAKHGAQWRATLSAYASPHLGSLLVSQVDTPQVCEVLRPIWHLKTETANRLRGRIETILDWANVQGFRSGPNPARWRGHLAHLFPSPRKVRPPRHYPAVPVRQVGRFAQGLRATDGVAARCLEFCLLTAVRSGEARSAAWEDIDMAAKVWNIPASKMKRKRPHRVPLSSAAISLLDSLPRFEGVSLVFPSPKAGAMLSDMALTQLMRRLKTEGVAGDGTRTQAVPHGLRSTFRDWAGEHTNHPRDVVEAALAHSLGNATETAYLRSEFFERRQRLMADWASFLDTAHEPAQVVPLRA